jgi:hypothetical protein
VAEEAVHRAEPREDGRGLDGQPVDRVLRRAHRDVPDNDKVEGSIGHDCRHFRAIISVAIWS